MSELFLVSIKSIDHNRGKVDFHLTIINPDQKSFYNTKSFALLLLLDPLDNAGAKPTAITDEIPLEDIVNLNLDIIKKKATKIIKKVDLHDIINFPPDTKTTLLTDDKFRQFWANYNLLPQAILTVLVKNASYISHLTEGQTWKSAAFNII